MGDPIESVRGARYDRMPARPVVVPAEPPSRSRMGRVRVACVCPTASRPGAQATVRFVARAFNPPPPRLRLGPVR